VKRKTLNIIEICLVLIIVLLCLLELFEDKISFSSNLIFLNNDIVFGLCVFIPLASLIILELVNISKENKRKQLENTMVSQLDKFQEVKNDSELSKVLEETIETQIKEIKSAKRDFKKIENLEQTIQIPMEEIQKQIYELNKKNKKVENDIVDEDTLVLFSKDDIKEVIKNELEDTENKKNAS